jgi:hypothetical protein
LHHKISQLCDDLFETIGFETVYDDLYAIHGDHMELSNHTAMIAILY